MPTDKTTPDQMFSNSGANPTIPDATNPFFGSNSTPSGATTPDMGPGVPPPIGAPRTPLAGFLVSFSRVEEGEYFPLYYGNNNIGSGADAKIRLNEERVSAENANISVWTDEENNCWYVQVVVRESTNPIAINGKKVLQIGQGIRIEHGTRITIGGYELYVVIVDKFKLGLSKNPEFRGKASPTDYSDPFFSFGKNIPPDPLATR